MSSTFQNIHHRSPWSQKLGTLFGVTSKNMPAILLWSCVSLALNQKVAYATDVSLHETVAPDML